MCLTLLRSRNTLVLTTALGQSGQHPFCDSFVKVADTEAQWLAQPTAKKEAQEKNPQESRRTDINCKHDYLQNTGWGNSNHSG